MNTAIKKLNINQTKIFWILVSLIVSMMVLQIYFAVMMTLQTADRGFLGESIKDMRSVISKVEYSLLEKNRTITREYAYSLGFQDVDGTLFVHRDPVRSLSLNE